MRDGEGRPATWSSARGPTTTGRYVAEVFVGGPCPGSGEGRSKKDAEQAGRRGVPAWPTRRWRGSRVPELPEVETLRQDLAKEVVGKQDQDGAVVNGRSVRRHASARTSAPGWRAAPSSRSAGWASTCCSTLDSGDMLVVHLGMSGQLLRAKSRQGPQAQAHPRGHHLHPGRRAALRRPADLRRDVRLDPALKADDALTPLGHGWRRAAPPSARCPSWPISASTRSRTS